MVMRLMGVTSIDQINRNHIITDNLSNRFVRSSIFESIYEPMKSIVGAKL
jgi:hypothetical protein